MDLAAVRRAVGPAGAGAQPGAHDAQLRDAGGVQRGDGAGHAQRAAGLRHVRQRAADELERPGAADARGAAGRSGLQPAAGIGGDRSRDGDTAGDRRLYRRGARPGGARIRPAGAAIRPTLLPALALTRARGRHNGWSCEKLHPLCRLMS